MPSALLCFRGSDNRLFTQVGIKRSDDIIIEKSEAGVGLYGPYLNLPKGKYQANIIFATRPKLRGRVVMDVCANQGNMLITSSQFDLATLKAATNDQRRASIEFSLSQDAAQLEVRLHCASGVTANIVALEIAINAVDDALVDGLLNPSSNAGVLNSPVMSMLDRIERLSHGGRATYVGNNRLLTKLVVKNSVLGFLVQADDRLIVPYLVVHGEYEPNITRYLTNTVRATDNCLDVGANYGYYTCLMASLATSGRTIGIEPDPEVFELVRDNININSFEARATAINAAVSNVGGRLTLYRRMTRSGNTSIIKLSDDSVRPLGESAPQPFDVDSISLSDLLPRFGGRIDFMKIDVEGAEPLAFRGAQKMIDANPRLKIIMEWSPGQIVAAGFDLGDFLAELSALGLRPSILGGSHPIPIAMGDLLNRPYESGVLLTADSP